MTTPHTVSLFRVQFYTKDVSQERHLLHILLCSKKVMHVIKLLFTTFWLKKVLVAKTCSGEIFSCPKISPKTSSTLTWVFFKSSVRLSRWWFYDCFLSIASFSSSSWSIVDWLNVFSFNNVMTINQSFSSGHRIFSFKTYPFVIKIPIDVIGVLNYLQYVYLYQN